CMPSQLHEALLLLLRNRPALAPELLRDTLQCELPAYTDVRIHSADLTELQPAEYRADLVLLLLDGEPVMGIVVEVQLSRDDRKQFVWPVYVANLRAQIKCPVCLLVVAGDAAVARWAARPIYIGGDHRLVPWVLGLQGIPEITDPQQAQADPELAVLSAIAHGDDADTAKSVRIALAAEMASRGLDPDRLTLYYDLIMASLSEAARRELQTMDRAKYQYQSDFAKRYVAEGKAEGEVNGQRAGKASLVARLLTLRFGSLTDEVQTRIAQSSIAELDAIGERLLTAATAEEALSSH
ncbi:MAG: DUF4351 domain-containing protein, partial [Steroidobacteraceae bacterium]